MSGNTIKEYSDIAAMLNLMLEDADADEAEKLGDALEYIREAALLLTEEKKLAAEALMESGEMTRDEYNQYMSYVEEFAFENAQELVPYTNIASIGTTLTLATGEHNALHSTRYNDILAMENGDILSPRDANFVRSRFAKYTKLFESVNDEEWESATENGVVTDELKNFLESAQNCWNQTRLKAEKDTKDYIMHSIEETGDADFVQECVEEAVSNGVISNFIAGRINAMIDHCELSMNH